MFESALDFISNNLFYIIAILVAILALGLYFGLRTKSTGSSRGSPSPPSPPSPPSSPPRR